MKWLFKSVQSTGKMDPFNIIFPGLGALRKFLGFPSFRNLDRH